MEKIQQAGGGIVIPSNWILTLKREMAGRQFKVLSSGYWGQQGNGSEGTEIGQYYNSYIMSSLILSCILWTYDLKPT